MIMELLYDGRIYPREEINCKDERYKQAEKEKKILYDSLYDRLDDEDKQLLEKIRDAMYDSQSYAQEEHFYYGLSMGMMLTQEVYERYGKRYFKTDK
ncbi:MAG: hypothetical protein LUI39_13110 [Lachnospiraceae bacterium]|nr:hypothetical protein [Clostridiales bacterium]MCD7717054.1 hypothetical protein [Lachnospiraceae bacterium]MCD7717357.1 hypothetical protein [Lachnospiraceae bacterium]MCD8363879.1 hypothetical protein [Lachnospiraceae bacterium]